MNKDIEDFITNCKTWQKYHTSIPAETIHQHEIPTYPWQYFSADLFKMVGNDNLLVADQIHTSTPHHLNSSCYQTYKSNI